MKQHTFKKRMISAVLSGAMLLSCAAMPVTTVSAESSGETPINTNFDNGVGLPWHTVTTAPALLKFDITGGTYNIEIINNGGEDVGGEDRYDCTFRHSRLTISAGKTYHLHAEVTATADGDFFTRVGDAAGRNDLWHNSMGATEQAKGYEGTPNVGTSWDNLKVTKGETLVIDAEFTAQEDVSGGNWDFYFGGAGQYQQVDCFPEGTKLTFDNMQFYEVGTTPPDDTSAQVTYEPHAIAVNQLGYFTDAQKIAVLHSDQPITAQSVWLINNTNLEKVKEYKLTPKKLADQKLDADSGRYTYQIDFSDFDTEGSYFLSLDDTEMDSVVFTVGDDLYKRVFKDAVNYFYQNRAQCPIGAGYISSKGENEDIFALAHNQYAKDDTGYVQNTWVRKYGSAQDIAENVAKITANGGWYDAESHTKSVTSGAYSLWILQNMVEFKQKYGDAKRFNENEEEIVTPEHDNDIPDILDECRYELDFLLSMMVPDDWNTYKVKAYSTDFYSQDTNDTKRYNGMLFHSMEDSAYTGIAVRPWNYIDDANYSGVKRIVRPPTVNATLAGAAVFAQASRLFKEYDAEYAEKLLEAAKTAYNAARANPDLIAPFDPVTGWKCTMPDSQWWDEFYWAACELYAATGDAEYYYADDALLDLYGLKIPSAVSCGDLYDSFEHKGDSAAAFSRVDTAALGSLTLLLNSVLGKDDHAALLKSLTDAADVFAEYAEKDGFSVPYQPTTWHYSGGIGEAEWTAYDANSNGLIAGNAMLLSYAYQLTGDAKYRSGAIKAMDYLFGCNPMDTSYVTGWGANAVKNPTHRYWAKEYDASFPSAPDGVLVSGPNSRMNDEYVAGLGYKRGQLAPQRCYVDDIEAWSVNASSLELNASLAWLTGFFSAGEKLTYSEGDFNGDGKVSAADAVFLARYLSADYKFNSTQLKFADLNNDKNVNAIDLTLLLRKLLQNPAEKKE